MQDAFDFAPAAPATTEPQATAIVAADLVDGLSSENLQWGRDAMAKAVGSGRKSWFTALSEDEKLRFAAATYRFARIRARAMELASAGAPQDSVGWINADPELAASMKVLNSGLVSTGDLPLL